MAQAVTKTKSNEVMVTPNNQLQLVKQWGQAFNELVATQNIQLTPTEKEFGMSIITNLSDRCIAGSINTTELNMTNFLEQVKHCSKLQLSINEQELYLDIRNDKNTGLKTVKISKQFQGVEKIMTRYCTKKIVRFKRGVVCKGDTFETVDDFDLGITKIVKHIKNDNIDRNNFANIEYVYDIAYVEEYGKLVPYTVIVDKNRLLRARNAASTDKVWISDTTKMCLKTAAWELWALMKPYIELPIGLQESFVATDDDLDWDKNRNYTDIDTEKVYDIDSNEASEPIIIEDAVISSSENENLATDTNVATSEEDDEEGIEYIDYDTEYKNNRDKYERAPKNGVDPFDKETRKIRVRRKV